MKRRKFDKLPPPFTMTIPASHEFFKIQDELPNQTARGHLTSDHLVWKLAVTAEHQADYKRRKISDRELQALKEYRRAFGLPELPPKQTQTPKC